MDTSNSTSFLNSAWLIKMLEKSSPTPHGRLLSLFDILEDWLEAPSIREQLNRQFSKPKNAKLLQDFLSAEATKAGAAMPEILANQLYFMAISAIQAYLQPNIHAGAGHAFNHAKSAANALILAQTKREFHIKKSSAYAMAASFFVATIVAGSWFTLRESSAPSTLAQASPQAALVAVPMASPDQTAALMAQLEQMRHGNCQLIEAIQLPDSQKGIYINMVVNGQVSTDPREQQIAIELLKKTRCNYTPMLMANSTG
jgi:ATP-dependent protease HslVU (ClpYQ) peptidase subunit